MCLHAQAGDMLNVYHLIIVVLEFADNNHARVHCVPLPLCICNVQDYCVFFTELFYKNTTLRLLHTAWGEWHTRCAFQCLQIICQPFCSERVTHNKVGNEMAVATFHTRLCFCWNTRKFDSDSTENTHLCVCLYVWVGQTHPSALPLWNFLSILYDYGQKIFIERGTYCFPEVEGKWKWCRPEELLQ